MVLGLVAALGAAVAWTFTTAAFFVTSTSPADGDQSALQDTTISATFSAPVNAATLTAASFSLTDSSGAIVPGSITYDNATFTATLHPTASLAAGASYTAHLAGTVAAADGTALPAPHALPQLPQW